MVLFHHGQEGLNGEIHVWTQTQKAEIYDQRTSQGSEPGPLVNIHIHNSDRNQPEKRSPSTAK